MNTTPNLIEEDVVSITSSLKNLVARTGIELALVTAEGGYVIFKEGKVEGYDAETIGTLACHGFMANQAISQRLHESGYNSSFQQGEKFGIFITQIDSYHLLIAVFPASIGLGLVKYYAAMTAPEIASQLKAASERAPTEGFDLATMNITDPTALFKRKDA